MTTTEKINALQRRLKRINTIRNKAALAGRKGRVLKWDRVARIIMREIDALYRVKFAHVWKGN